MNQEWRAHFWGINREMQKFSKEEQIISFTKSKRRVITTCVVLAILLTFLIVCIPYFQTTRISTCMGNRIDRIGVLTREPLVQRFVPTGRDLEYVELHYSNCDANEGTIHFSIEDKKGNVLFSQDDEIANLEGDPYIRYEVNLKVKANGTYYIRVFVDGVIAPLAPKLWLSNNVSDEIRDVIYYGQDPNVRMQANVELGYSVFHYASFAIAFVSILFSGLSALIVLHLSENKRRSLGMGVLLIMPVVMCILAETLNNNSILNKSMYVWMINYLLYFLIYCFFYALTNKLRFTVIFSNALILILAIINFYKLQFRGEPFTFADVVSFGTAMNVASEYKIGLSYLVITTGSVFVLITSIVSRIRYSVHHKRTRLIIGALSVALGVFMVSALFDTDRYSASADSIMKRLGIVNNVWNQPKNYSDNGMMVALTMNAQYLTVEQPEVYSLEDVDNVISDVDANYGMSMLTGRELSDYYRNRQDSQQEMPNIIVIMNESYSDFSQFENVELSQPLSPFMDSLDENTISGDLHVSTFGGGTANSEFEFLTGNSMIGVPSGSIPYQQYINGDTGSMARILSNLGYNTIALHPYLASGWNRPLVYDYMEFDQFLSDTDFTDPEYIRSYISDSCSFAKIIELYEQNETEGNGNPLFLFNVTMQNHGSYSKTYVNFEPDVEYVPDPGAFPEAEQYFSVARNTDIAMQELIEYFSNVDEPTIIVFFGDHLPSFNDGFYEMLMGVEDTSNLNSEQMGDLYTTDYLIWANYGIQTPEIPNISLNYLSTLVMQVAGLPMTDYQMFLSQLHASFPVISTMGVYDINGNYLGGTNLLTETDLWNYYSLLIYNEVFEDNDRRAYVFDYPHYMALQIKEEMENEAASGSSIDALPAEETTGREEEIVETTTED